MTRAIAPIQSQAPITMVQDASGQWTVEQMKLITDVVAKGATPDELKLFLYRCNKMGLDPLKAGQIYFIKYGTNPGTIVIGIEGFRSRAARTGKLKGIKRGVLRDDKGSCVGAWAKVKRADWDDPAEVEVSLVEYDTKRAEWAKKPETMIQKVAEAAALRMAFPDELGDAYTEEEMAKTAMQGGGVYPEQPQPGDGVQTGSYCVPYGPLAKQPIEECDPAQLRDYVLTVEAKAQKSGRPLGAWAVEMIKHAEPLIADWENQQAAALREPGDE